MALSPIVIQGFKDSTQQLSPLQLKRIALDAPPYNEDWLQNLIHNYPALVPAGEVESSFDDIISVMRELPLSSGYLDNLYITPDGYPVLVEVKLWKNQESRRKVVAQILEYAKNFAEIKYEILNSEISKIRKTETWGANPLYEIVSRNVPNPLDEATFVDRVSRNIREGRFLLLILGDGIREDMESLANYLLHHSLRYAFGIIQIKLFTMPDGSILAFPDVMAKTQTIERHVTVVNTQGADMSVSEAPTHIVTEKTEKTSISEDGFYEAMSKTSPESILWLKDFIQSLSDLQIETQVGSTEKNLMLKARIGSDYSTSLLCISPPYIEFWGLANKYKKTPETMKIVHNFLDRIASIVPPTTVEIWKSGHMDIKFNGGRVPLNLLHGKEAKIKEAIRQVIQEITAVEDDS